MISLFRDYYTLRGLRDYVEDKQSAFRRWKHWTKVDVRRWMINHYLYRRRCSECCMLIDSYGYEGIYDMCTNCFHEAHPY